MDQKPVCKTLSKRWFKFYAERWLLGDIRDLSPIERSVLVDLYCLASLDGGEIRFSNTRSVAKRYGYTAKQFEVALQNLLEKNEISVKIEDDKRTYMVTGWDEYQADCLKKAAKKAQKSDTDSPPREEQSRGDEIDKISSEPREAIKTAPRQLRVSAPLRADPLRNQSPNSPLSGRISQANVPRDQHYPSSWRSSNAQTHNTGQDDVEGRGEDDSFDENKRERWG